MSDFQLIVPAAQTGNGARLIYFTIGTSYMNGAGIYYNVTGVDEEHNSYTALMTRSQRGEFLIQNLQLIT